MRGQKLTGRFSRIGLGGSGPFWLCLLRSLAIIGTLSSDDDDASENVRKTIVLISKTLAVHVRYNLWYIFLPSSGKQRREMTTIKVFWRTSTQARFSTSSKINASIIYLFPSFLFTSCVSLSKSW